MKYKMDIVSRVSLEEIRAQLIENLSTKELVDFVLSFPENSSESEEFWMLLHKKTEKIFFEIRQDNIIKNKGKS